MKYCPKCGNINSDKAKFCYSCGHPFPEETIKEDTNTETVVEQEKGSPYYKVENNKTFIGGIEKWLQKRLPISLKRSKLLQYLK